MSSNSNRKGLEVTVPTSLRDITLSQHVKYTRAVSGDVELNEEAATELIVTIFCNIHLKHMNLLKLKQVDDILSRVLPILGGIKTNLPLVRRFTMDGVEYGMIPNLDEMSYGENKGITTFMKDSNDYHKAMGILYRPIIRTFKDTYEIEEYDGSNKYYDVMQSMPLDILLGAQVFFWTLIKDLLNSIPNYLRKNLGEKTYQDLIQKVFTNQPGEVMMKSSV